MHDIVFRAHVRDERDRPHFEAVIHFCLDALVKADVDWLRRHPKTPSLYSSGVRYQREHGTDVWKEVPDVLADGEGDCEDLASWRVAELRVRGLPAEPRVIFQRVSGLYLYHIVVDRGGGRLEDPSRKLGMGGPEDV